MSCISSTIPVPRTPAPAGPTDRPGYTPPKGTIARLREERRVRRIARSLYDGDWRDVLVKAGATQFLFRKVTAGDAKERTSVKTLFAHLNLVELCVDMHAETLMASPVKAIVPDAFADQQLALDRIRGACLLDTVLAEAARTAYLEGYAALRTDLDEEGNGIVRLDDNDTCFPVGPDGADQQPTVWERRWIIERPSPTRKGEVVRYLRVERHRAGLVEHEAYLSKDNSSDVLQELEGLKRVTVGEAVGADATGYKPVPLDRIETGCPWPLVTRLVRKMKRGRPALLFSEQTLSLLDAQAGILSMVCRSHSAHYAARMRVLESMIDKRTGEVDMTQETVVDPDKQVGYIAEADLKLEEGLKNWERIIRAALVQARTAPALVGINPGEGAQTVSAESRRIQASTTISCARGAQQHAEPAFGRSLTIACILDTRQGMRGYDVSPVVARLMPEIPADETDRIDREERKLTAGLTSRWRAIAALHGEDQADAVLAEIEEDDERKSENQAKASFGAVGIGDQGSGISDADPARSAGPPEPEGKVAA